MKNTFILGSIAGISCLALAVPLLAQMSSAQNPPAQPMQQASGMQADPADTPDAPGALDSKDKKDALETPDVAADPTLAKINADAAKATALQAHPGQVREIKLETDDGPLVYSVMILNGIQQYEVRVDAVSGKVLFNKLDEANYHQDENEQPGTENAGN